MESEGSGCARTIKKGNQEPTTVGPMNGRKDQGRKSQDPQTDEKLSTHGCTGLVEWDHLPRAVTAFTQCRHACTDLVEWDHVPRLVDLQEGKISKGPREASLLTLDGPWVIPLFPKRFLSTPVQSKCPSLVAHPIADKVLTVWGLGFRV